MTWLDRHDGSWWAGFANYDILVEGEPYGETDNTQIVQLDDRFNVVAAYNIPQEILDRFKPMSNSGGSWGPDGRLWLTGHDLGEAYVMEVPEAGSELQWIATVELPGVEGQGIAWDRSGRGPTLWTIQRSTKQVNSSPCRTATSRTRARCRGRSSVPASSTSSRSWPRRRPISEVGRFRTALPCTVRGRSATARLNRCSILEEERGLLGGRIA
jgi:hypothetical protein